MLPLWYENIFLEESDGQYLQFVAFRDSCLKKASLFPNRSIVFVKYHTNPNLDRAGGSAADPLARGGLMPPAFSKPCPE